MNLISKIKDFRNRPFLKNSIILISGTAVGQLIPVISAPIVTRIFNPEQYGIFGVFLILTSVLGLFSTFQIENAILIEKEDSNAGALLQLSIFLSIVTSVIVLVASLLFKNEIAAFFNAPALIPYLLFLPLVVFLTGTTNSLTAWANRLGSYKILSFQRIVSAIVTPLITIVTGYLTHSVFGLFLGFSTGLIVGILFLYFRIISDSRVFKYSYKEMGNMFSRYSSIPKYNLPSQFMNMFLIQFPGILLSRYYSVSSVGYYNLSNRMLNMPTLLISQSLGEIYKKKASTEFHETGSCENSFVTFFKLLFFISIVPFIILFIFSPQLFGIIFGENWVNAGVFSRIMTLMFFLRFIISPLTFVSFLRDKLKIHLLFTAILLVTTVIVCMIMVYNKANVESLLLSYVLNYSWIYILIFFVNYKFSKNKW